MADTTLKIKRGVKAYSENGEVIAEFYSVRREGDKLIIDSRALGVMRMDMILTPGEVLRSIGVLVGWATISFMLLIPYFALRSLFRRRKE